MLSSQYSTETGLTVAVKAKPRRGVVRRYRELFSVFPRVLESGRKVYYYQTYDPDGRRMNPKSTGAIRARDARMYCMKLYREGTLGVTVKKTPTFAEFSVGWWDVKTCQYLKSRMAKRTISTSYARQGKRHLEKHLIPAFGKKPLDAITSRDVDAWMVSYLDGGWAPNSVNLMFTILKVMLEFAVKKGLIEKNPCADVQRAAHRKTKVEIMTVAEVKRLFDPADLDRLWAQEAHYTLNMLAATTGMRLGEIQGLRGEKVYADFVEVSRQYNGFREFTDTKTHDTRYVTIPAVVVRGLFRLKEFNGDGFLFSTDGGKTPMSRSAISEHFHKALDAIDIDRAEQTRRGLTFHKWRHFLNTTLRMGNVADSKVRGLTGHKSEAMTDHYTHFDPRSFGDVKRIQEGIALATLAGDQGDEKRGPEADCGTGTPTTVFAFGDPGRTPRTIRSEARAGALYHAERRSLRWPRKAVRAWIRATARADRSSPSCGCLRSQASRLLQAFRLLPSPGGMREAPVPAYRRVSSGIERAPVPVLPHHQSRHQAGASHAHFQAAQAVSHAGRRGWPLHESRQLEPSLGRRECRLHLGSRRSLARSARGLRGRAIRARESRRPALAGAAR